ncbi:-Transmembrane and coiled-coil domains protein 1 [Babesia bigemina]|uniref:-Transmembrane and coiled-coil domains protein 1 n=1 Tax=Babesia bigemina TaxID=5866 RepID=A0A061DBQ1_BABBI|nr:-Transmembrane and coiled-coil domains protein 1 [Babesia bigemina]CDR97993.1 -Transmembrane and coiled-coil domains protein 1 [Babesia bigemina]|eukprot:XP_012770179.1 -Transmembrane and coiled-coil domains protein 1 [Babesia bigemina]
MEAVEHVPFEKRDLILVALFSIFCGILKECAAYYFVYRRADYQKKFAEVCDRYEDYHRTYVMFEPQTAHHNCFRAVSLRLLEATRDLRNLQTFYTFITSVIFMILMLMVMSYFEGCVVAKLPFEPVWPLSLFTLGDTMTTDVTNCSATCIYTMLSMAVKDGIQTLLGYRSPMTTFSEMSVKSGAEQSESK